MTVPLSRLVLYERTDCLLCDEARALLDEMLGPHGYQRIDIGGDDDLVLRYGFRVPVLTLDGVDRLEAPITAPDLRGILHEAEALGR